jgi:hypothetical protein
MSENSMIYLFPQRLIDTAATLERIRVEALGLPTHLGFIEVEQCGVTGPLDLEIAVALDSGTVHVGPFDLTVQAVIGLYTALGTALEQLANAEENPDDYPH